MIHHIKGSTQILEYRRKKTKYLLLSYLGQFRRNDKRAVFRLKQALPTGQELVIFEVWECLNLETGIKENKKVPVYMYEESTNDYVDSDRLEVIDDNQEVTSLFDSLECWKNNFRDKVNFRLELINSKHQSQLDDLRRLDSMPIVADFKKGVRLKLIQKETPNLETLKAYKEWEVNYPEYAIQLKQYVYTNPSDFMFDTTIELPEYVRYSRDRYNGLSV